MLVYRNIKADEFKQMCRDQEEKQKELKNSGAIKCEVCKGTGTHQGKKGIVIFGCRECRGIGYIEKELTI